MELTSKGQKEIDEASEIANLKKVEAALFISARFLNLQELVTLTDINPILLRELLDKLLEKYNANSAIEILSKGESWKMDVKQEHRDMVNKLATGSAEFPRADQETLAVIAYKQPVKQSVIVKIRGNKAYEHIKNFIELGLIKARKLGHTQELTLSDDFYDYFSIGKKSLEESREDIEKQDKNFKEIEALRELMGICKSFGEKEASKLTEDKGKS